MSQCCSIFSSPAGLCPPHSCARKPGVLEAADSTLRHLAPLAPCRRNASTAANLRQWVIKASLVIKPKAPFFVGFKAKPHNYVYVWIYKYGPLLEPTKRSWDCGVITGNLLNQRARLGCQILIRPCIRNVKRPGTKNIGSASSDQNPQATFHDVPFCRTRLFGQTRAICHRGGWMPLPQDCHLWRHLAGSHLEKPFSWICCVSCLASQAMGFNQSSGFPESVGKLPVNFCMRYLANIPLSSISSA